MKQMLLFTLSSFAIATLMTACSGQMTDKIAPTLSSDPCAALDKKILRLDRFTEVVRNTSAFHLEEKATAIPVPGITVSNNRKQMLRDAEKKQVGYAVERQKYGCETPISISTVQMADKKTVVSKPVLSSGPCHAIDKKLMKLDQFTTMVSNTSAFYLEEKATALTVPGITVSNNRKQMLRDAERKRTELLQESQKYGCETSIARGAEPIPDKKAVANKPVVSSDSSVDNDNKMVKPDDLTTKVNSTSTVHVDEKVIAVSVAEITVDKKEQIVSNAKKKDTEAEVERQKYADENSISAGTEQIVDQKEMVSQHAVSSDACDTIDKELIKLYEFMIMVNNTSAFHLEEKVAAMPVPGITVSNNKKKMLRDAERKRAELLSERQKQGCKIPTK